MEEVYEIPVGFHKAQPLGIGWLYVEGILFEGRAGLDPFNPDSFGGPNCLLSFSWKNQLGVHPCDSQELLQIPLRNSGEQSRGLSCLDAAEVAKAKCSLKSIAKICEFQYNFWVLFAGLFTLNHFWHHPDDLES